MADTEQRYWVCCEGASYGPWTKQEAERLVAGYEGSYLPSGAYWIEEV